MLIVLSLSEGLSLIGACSRLEVLLAAEPLGTNREGDGSPPKVEHYQHLVNTVCRTPQQKGSNSMLLQEEAPTVNLVSWRQEADVGE